MHFSRSLFTPTGGRLWLSPGVWLSAQTLHTCCCHPLVPGTGTPPGNQGTGVCASGNVCVEVGGGGGEYGVGNVQRGAELGVGGGEKSGGKCGLGGI